MKKLVLPLLALITISVSAQTSANYKCELAPMANAGGTIGPDTTFKTPNRIFVPDGQFKGEDNFYFMKMKYGTLLVLDLHLSKLYTYDANQKMNFMLGDSTEIQLSVGPRNVIPQYNSQKGEWVYSLMIALTDQEVATILQKKMKMIYLAQSIWDGVIFLQPLAKELFVQDLNCINNKKM